MPAPEPKPGSCGEKYSVLFFLQPLTLLRRGVGRARGWGGELPLATPTWKSEDK